MRVPAERMTSRQAEMWERVPLAKTIWTPFAWRFLWCGELDHVIRRATVSV